MGRYTNSSRNQSSTSGPKETHGIWRGIGCLMMMIIPVISIAAGVETFNYAIANKWPIPYQLLGPVILPDIFYSTQGLRTIVSPLNSVPNFYAKAVASLLIMILLSGTISVIYAFVYSFVGPSRYGPTDVPPLKVRSSKKSR